ncbi:sensor histidine kinase [Seonamhaeicola maritimus]|uniref:sensor histidine kinase n=1 Tax=Seonamhaeicola maritimus TaxID=2591822 RepID=UPI002494F5F9|nr:sensor histidine kinase [Seonamhaeicola maritimus]
MSRKLNYIITLTASLCLAVFGYAQNNELKLVDSLVKEKQVKAAYGVLQKIDSTTLDETNKAQYYKLFAENLLLDNQSDKAYLYYIYAKRLYTKLDDKASLADINLDLVVLLNASDFENLDYQPFLDDYMDYAKAQNDPALLAKAYMQVGKCFINNQPEKTIYYFKESLKYGSHTNDTLLNAKINHNVGVLYAEHTSYLDSALYHYNIAFKEYKRQNLIDYMSYIYNNKATVYEKQKKYDLAIENYLRADSLPIKEYRKKNKQLLYGFIADAYEKNKQTDKALEYLKLHLTYKDSVSEDEQNTQILDIQTRYETEKKEKENLKLKQNRIWLSTILIIVLLLFIISYYAYRNQKGKKQIVEKEKELQSQKLEKILKNQELSSIDAMVAGQEKERQRIANDLHDNLGSLLATLKLHFHNLKVKKDRLKSEENALFDKTDELIEETYQKVRSMAHAKNAGIKANESLLPAVKNFASKVSLANKLVIDVIDDGMEVRLDNALEITIFRVIQELITNIIKHANASEANIHLTHHGDSINILVEDNGVGFDVNTIKAVKGMGLHSIQTRVESLEGKVTVESIESKGTSVIIDIPIV